MERRLGKMIKKYRDHIDNNVLRYSILDWDENILFMPTIVHLEINRNDRWVPVDVSCAKFSEAISKGARLRNKSYKQTFTDMSDDGPRGNKVFLLDTIEAVKNGDFGPSWDDFIYSLIDGRLFLIITARGHEPETIKKGVEWIIYNYLTDDQRRHMKDNLMKFHELFGYAPEDAIRHFLDLSDYVGVMSDYFKETFDVPDMKISQLVGYGKSLAIKRFLDRVRGYSKEVGLPAKVGFSDDRSRTVDEVGEFLSGEKFLDGVNDHDIKYYIFDTSGNGKKKIRL